MALTKYNSQRRLEIDQKASQNFDAALSPNDKGNKFKEESIRDELKWREILDKDTEMAEEYRNTYQDIKAEKELDENEANRLYDKYNYIMKGEHRDKVLLSDKYELGN